MTIDTPKIGLNPDIICSNRSSDTMLANVAENAIPISIKLGFFFYNVVMPRPVLNFMLIGMAFSATFANMVSEDRLEEESR